jgi:hypothetical protein
MNKDQPKVNQRRSLRLKNYDYTSSGAYFVTICVQNREYLFGQISVGAGPEKGQPRGVAPTVILNDAVRMIIYIDHQSLSWHQPR